MTASEIRQEARNSLTGKWGKGALIFLIFAIISGVLSFVLCILPFVGPLILALIELPLAFGLLVTLINLKRDKEWSYTSFFNNGLNNFKQVWFVQLRIFLKLLPYILIIIITSIVLTISTILTVGSIATSNSINTIGGGFAILAILSYLVIMATSIAMIPKALLYSLSFFILYDNPSMSALEIVNESERLMKGNRWRLFCLSLSFIGWAFLASFTLGIGFLFLAPYMQIATIIFYEKLASIGGKVNTTDNSNDEYEIVSNEEPIENTAKDDDEE